MLRRSTKRTRHGAPPCVGCRGKKIDNLDAIEPLDTAKITQRTQVAPIAGLQSCVLDRQLVALDPLSGNRVLLNASAALIFTAIDRPIRVGDLVEQLAQETGVKTRELHHDVLATLRQLLARDMITIGVSRQTTAKPPRSNAALGPTPQGLADKSPACQVAGVTFVVRLATELHPRNGMMNQLLQSFACDEPAGDIHFIDVTVVSPLANDVPLRVQTLIDGVPYGDALESTQTEALVFDAIDELLVREAKGLRFHAGAVEREGRAIVVLGPSGRGKSTLTAALVQRGFSYGTDELVVVDSTTHRFAPYPRPLDLDDDSLAQLKLTKPDVVTGRKKNKVVSTRLGESSSGGLVVMIVLLDDDRSQKPGLLTPLGVAEGLMASLPMVFGATFENDGALSDLGALHTHASIVKVNRGPVKQLAQIVEQEFNRLTQENKRSPTRHGCEQPPRIRSSTV